MVQSAITKYLHKAKFLTKKQISYDFNLLKACMSFFVVKTLQNQKI